LTTLDVCSSSAQIDSSSEDEIQDSVEGLAFSTDPNLDFLVSGSVQGNIIVWDLATMVRIRIGFLLYVYTCFTETYFRFQTERVKIHQDSGITKLLWHPTIPLIFTAGIDGVIRVIDARTCKIEKNYGRHRTEILDICISK